MRTWTNERIYPSLGDDYKKPGILLIIRVILSAAALGVLWLVKLPENVEVALPIAAALICGYDLVIYAVKDIQSRVIARENLIVVVAAILSFAIGRGREGVIALLLLQLSYIIRDYAFFRTRKSVCENIEPGRKMLEGARSGEAESKGENENEEDGGLVVYEGMEVPFDCVIREGSGTADLSFITGDGRKVSLKKGDYLPAGCVCSGGQFIAEAAQTQQEALYRKMASALKAGYGEITGTEAEMTKRSGLFVTAVLTISLVLFLVLFFAVKTGYQEAIRRAVSVIAVASPCGVLASFPLTYFSGMAAGRKSGILFTHASAIENTASVKAVVFNKTGTITNRDYLVSDIRTDKMDPATFLKVAAYAAANSKSELAAAVVGAFGEKIDAKLLDDFMEYPEKGVSASVDGIQILLGRKAFLTENGVTGIPRDKCEGTMLYMSVNSIYAGWIALSESIKEDASASFIADLAKSGIDRIATVSEDSRDKDRTVANKLGIEEYYAECTTETKKERIGEIKSRIDRKAGLAFVGDCKCPKELFDAADVGMMTNGISCRNEVPEADVVIMKDSITLIPDAIRTARRTVKYAMYGVAFGLLIKLVIIVLAAVGLAPLWFALLIDYCASLAVLLNSSRLYLRTGR